MSSLSSSNGVLRCWNLEIRFYGGWNCCERTQMSFRMRFCGGLICPKIFVATEVWSHGGWVVFFVLILFMWASDLKISFSSTSCPSLHCLRRRWILKQFMRWLRLLWKVRNALRRVVKWQNCPWPKLEGQPSIAYLKPLIYITNNIRL